MKEDFKQHKVFLIACEASGDIATARVMKQMKAKYPNILFQGVGGDAMVGEGLELVFHYKEIAVMGFFEVLPKIPKILMRMRQVIGAIRKFEPDLLLTTDGPGFNFRVVKKVRRLFGHAFKIVHYVAPTVWAYKPERAKTVAKLYDHILLMLPFEKPYFDAVHMESTFVGHHILESQHSEKTEQEILEKFGVKAGVVPILIMPGSRRQEIQFMGSIFNETVMRLQDHHRLKCIAFVPTSTHLEKEVHQVFGGTNTIISSNPQDKLDFFKIAKVGIIKSGTSSLEAAYYNIPAVVAYKMSSLTYAYIKRLVQVKFISIVNLLLNKLVIPELIQKDCTPEKIAESVMHVLSDDNAESTKRDYAEALGRLRNTSCISPSQCASDVILMLLKGM